jgi:hypothetical protein
MRSCFKWIQENSHGSLPLLPRLKFNTRYLKIDKKIVFDKNAIAEAENLLPV